MAFGKKNKIEIQYYVDQIDKLKEENASLNALINDQSIELKHYKAFFNSNSKLLEASNRMNIACGDIQDAFDNLIDHAEAIRFPDQQNINSYAPSENFSDENAPPRAASEFCAAQGGAERVIDWLSAFKNL